MAKKRREPKHSAIVEANLDLLAQLPTFLYEHDIEDAASVCWGCGIQTKDGSPFCRCHIVPHSRGGSNDPSNYFILCNVCHDEQPDGLSRDCQVEWLLAKEGVVVLSLKIFSSIFDEITRLNYPANRDDIYKFMEEMGFDKIDALMKEGYESAAGWKNGRANFQWLFNMKFREWYEKQKG